MAYELIINNVQFPVAPAQVQISHPNRNKTITLINDTDVNVIKPQGLKEYSFELLLPRVKYPWAKYPWVTKENGFIPAEYYQDLLINLKTQGKVFNFSLRRTLPNGTELPDINLDVSLEELSFKEDVANGVDLVAELKLKEFVEYGAKLEHVSTNVRTAKTQVKVVAKARKSSKEKPKSYVVKKDDTLWKICKKELGNGSRHAEIAKLNGINNTGEISVGRVIKLG